MNEKIVGNIRFQNSIGTPAMDDKREIILEDPNAVSETQALFSNISNEERAV